MLTRNLAYKFWIWCSLLILKKFQLKFQSLWKSFKWFLVHSAPAILKYVALCPDPPPAPWASVILACCLTQESNTVNYFWTSKHGKISSTWTSGHQIQQFWTKGAVVILGLYGNAGLIILILSFLRQRPKEQPLLLFRGWGRVEVMQRLLALPSHPASLLLLTRHQDGL